MYRIVLALTLVLALVVPTAASAAEHTKDSLDTVRKNLKEKKAILFDVRERSEWEAGHLDLATLVPLSELREKGATEGFKKALEKKVKDDQIIYCHCRSGGRVLPASDVLKKMGYDVRPLKWGFQALTEAGFAEAKEE